MNIKYKAVLNGTTILVYKEGNLIAVLHDIAHPVSDWIVNEINKAYLAGLADSLDDE